MGAHGKGSEAAGHAGRGAGQQAQQHEEEQEQATFGGSRSMRENYEEGVDAYYEAHGNTYRNPHFPGIVAACSSILDVWLAKHLLPTHPELPQGEDSCSSQAAEGSGSAAGWQGPGHAPPTPNCLDSGYCSGPQVRFLDLACGAGEATQAVEAWWWGSQAVARAMAKPPGAPEEGPSSASITADAAAAGDGGDGPGEAPTISGAGAAGVAEDGQQGAGCSKAGETGEEAAAGHGAGSQEVSEAGAAEASAGAAGDQGTLSSSAGASSRGSIGAKLGVGLSVDAADPYTREAYALWTGRQAETFTFQDIGAGLLIDEGRCYHVAICSYAMHVLSPSFLFSTLQQLALACEALILISPHKLPKVEERTGWTLVEHLVVERVHARLFVSNTLQCSDLLQLEPGAPGVQ